MKHPNLDAILQRVKQHLTALYQENLQAVILYGSQARQESREDSDIDILVVLNKMVSPYREIDKTSQFIAQLCLDYDVLISRHFISFDRFKTGHTPFLKNVKDEGVTV